MEIPPMIAHKIERGDAMSGFLNDLKKTFAGIDPKPALDETSKAIMDIESKKNAISKASTNEQNAIKSKVSETYRRIGETSYKLHKEDIFDVDKIVAMFDTVTEHLSALDESKSKLDEILGRYDEELKILKPAPPAGQLSCPNCNAAYVPGETVFCSSCGNKVQEVTVGANGSEAAPIQQPVCSKCNAEIIPGAVFCASCGNKI